MQVPWGDGTTKTMCAKTTAPSEVHKAAILALKGITAASGVSGPAGSKAGLISLVTETNKRFDDMVGDLFPRTSRVILAPQHVGLCRLEVKERGILSLNERDIGTIQIFYDINKA